jgi:Fe-S cluster assembly ATP-binding protein
VIKRYCSDYALPAFIDYIVPDFVHVLLNGKIVKSGDASLALELEEGYDWIKQEQK